MSSTPMNALSAVPVRAFARSALPLRKADPISFIRTEGAFPSFLFAPTHSPKGACSVSSDSSDILRPGERLDEVNDHIRLIQKTDGLTFGTDALLLASYLRKRPDAIAAELGGGSGIVSLLGLFRQKFAKVLCIEIQSDYADLIRRNAILNHVEDRLTVLHADLRFCAADGKSRGWADLVFANPPYLCADSGQKNRNLGKSCARHEENGTVADFCAAAARLLRYGGKFVCVFRPERLPELYTSLAENRLTPKRLTLVHSHPRAKPSLILTEAVAGGHAGLQITRPLFLYRSSDNMVFSDDMIAVYNGDILPQLYE